MNSNRKMSKRIISSSLVAASLVASLGCAGVQSASAAAVSAENLAAVKDSELTTAGVSTTLTALAADAFDNLVVSVDDSAVTVVAADATGAEVSTTVAIAEDTSDSEEAQESAEWEDRLMADVDDYLTIRESASADSPVVGKLYKGAVADVKSTEDGWVCISSGSVEGYVSDEYCVVGEEAKELADDVCDTVVTSTTSGLRIRESASEDAEVLTVMYEGATATLNTEAEAEDGWVPVTYNGVEGYVSEEYAESELDLSEAISTEEEQAAIEAAKAAEEKQAANQTTELTRTQNAAVAASYDDVTLLAALIQCEAGNEPYEGQLAVGAVVMNRLRGGRYGSSIYDVIYAPYQFGPAGRGKVAAAAAAGPSGSCIQAAQEALGGASNIGGCTSFHRNDGRAGTVIGNHVFY